MGMIFKDVIGIIDHTRKFDSNELIDDPRNWSFKYTTLTTTGKDATIASQPFTIDEDKTHYSQNTIFLDSDPDEIYMTSTVETVVIDNTPPEIVKANIQYTTVLQDHRCQITFKSDTFLDVRQLKINVGDDLILYSIDRKSGERKSAFISEIILNKIGDEYTFEFYLPQDDALISALNEHQLHIKVWDIAGNCCEYTTGGEFDSGNPYDTTYGKCTTSSKWINVNDQTCGAEEELYAIQALEITFIKYEPEDKVVTLQQEGKTNVMVYNPTKAYWPIEPHVELASGSIGYLDESTKSYDPNTGIMTFQVNNITDTGDVIVHAWLAVTNTIIYETIKTATEATAALGPWLAVDEGRKYKLTSYVPKLLTDEKFKDFVKYTELFLNTCMTSLDSGRYISILEKVARINNFNDIQAIERKLLDQFRVTYNVEVNPNYEDLKTYLENKTVNVETVYKTVIDNDESSVTQHSDGNGVTVRSTDTDSTEITTTETSVESAYKNPLTIEDINELMRYVYKTIPYYNQIKGTRQGIKMILNTMGLCVKLVDVWSEHNTLSNKVNRNTERRADELQAEIYDDDYDSIDIDIGKFYLTSRFDVDLGQTDLTFREFNKIAANIVNIIFQVKPVTRVLRKLSYIFAVNTDLHFKYFNLVDANVQQFHCFDYVWNLFDPYSLSKSIHDVDAKTCNKLFVPYKANYAQVTYKAFADHNKVPGSKLIPEGLWNFGGDDVHAITRGTLVSRKASTNTFHNLCNFAYKMKKSHESVLHTHYAYFETRKYNTIKKIIVNGKQSASITTVYELWCNNKYVMDLTDGTDIDIIDLLTNKEAEGAGNIELVDYDMIIPTQAYITSETNGFNIEFDRASIAVLRKTGYRSTLMEPITESKQEDMSTVAQTEITPIGLFIMLKFAIPLGTKFITQFIGDGEDITILNPDDDSETPKIATLGELTFADGPEPEPHGTFNIEFDEFDETKPVSWKIIMED